MDLWKFYEYTSHWENEWATDEMKILFIFVFMYKYTVDIDIHLSIFCTFEYKHKLTYIDIADKDLLPKITLYTV